jgi:hypothetical protein
MGGPVAPGMAAQEAMMAPQNMAPQSMPPAAAAQDPVMMAQQTQDMAAQQTQGLGAEYAQNTLMNIDRAETPEQIINALRGNEAPMEQRYAELAQFVGEADAQRTPESVLALVQPTIMMTEQGAMDSGIGELMQGLTGEIEMETAEGAPTAMGQGVGSLMMAGAPAAPEMGVGQQPVANFRQGGVVQRFQAGGEASRLQQLYSEMLPTYQSILGDGGEQRRLTQAQILFDIADRAGAFAAGVDPRTGQSIARLSPAAQLAAATSGLGGQIGERLGSQEEQDRALRLAALQAAQGEFSAERAAARAAGSRDRALGTLYDVYDREGNLVQQGVPIANREEYDAVIGALGEGARITPARTDTVSFDTTTLYGPDGSPVTIDTSTAAGVTRARDLIDNGGFTTVAPTAAGFDTTTLYGPDGTPVTIDTSTAAGVTRARDLIDNGGFTTVAPTAAGFDTTTLYGPDGTPVTIDTSTAAGVTRARDLMDNEGFTTVAPTEAGFDTTTLYGPDGRPVTINTGTPEGQARADDLLTNQSFTTVAPTGEIGKQYEAVDAQGNVLASAFLADRAAFDKFVADYPNTTVREAVTQELGDEVLLYNPNDLNAPPVRERVGTPTYNTSRNAGLRTLEEIDELRKLTTTEAPSGEFINIQMPDGSVRSVRADSPEADALIAQNGRRVSTTAARTADPLVSPDVMSAYAAGTLPPDEEARVQALIAENTQSVFNSQTGQFEQPTITPLVRQAEEARRTAGLSTVLASPEEGPAPDGGAERERVLTELGGSAFGTVPFFQELANAAFAFVDANAPFPEAQEGVDAVAALNQDALIAFREATGGRTAQEAVNAFAEILPTPALIRGSPAGAASEIRQVVNLFNAQIETGQRALQTGVALPSERQRIEQGILSAQAMVRAYQALLQGIERASSGSGVDPAQFRK